MKTSAKQNHYTKRIVAWATGFRYEDLPPQAISEAKTIVMDTLGAMLLGSSKKYRASWLAGELAKLMGGKPECTIVGRDFKTSCESAALANGTMGYAADAEGGGAARLHASALLVPTALAMGEREHADGKAFIASLAVGYEFACRVSEACRTSHSYPHSFHPSAVFGHFGAAAVASYLLKLKEPEFATALGLAGSTAGGLITWLTDKTENCRPYVIGVAARNGVTAALLAQMGFGGPPRILDPVKYNIYDAYAGEMHLERLTQGLGTEYWIMKTGGYKQYSCCGDIHTGLDALLALLDEHKLSHKDIAQIVHHVKADRAPVIDNNEVLSHNAQYMMAVAAVNRRIAPDDILLDRQSDPRIRDMRQRVKLVGDPQLDTIYSDAPWMAGLPANSPARVEVTTNDGRRFEKTVPWPKGSPQNPMSAQELKQKFMAFSTTVLPEKQAERLMASIEALDSVHDISELAALTGKG